MYLKSDPTKRYNLVANRPDNRPSTQTVEFNSLIPEGAYVLAGVARADLGGQGATVASAVSEVQVHADVVASVDLTFQSTLKTIQIQGQPLQVPVGTTLTLTGRALDPDNNVILLPAGALKWTLVSGGAFGSLTSEGVFTATAAGTVHVKLAEAGAGVSAEADIQVVATGGGGLDSSGWAKPYGDLLNSGRIGSGATATGIQKWKLEGVGNPGLLGVDESPAIASDGNIYVVKDNRVVAVDPADGSVKWQSNTIGSILSGVTLGRDGTIYAVQSENFGIEAIAIDKTTGNRKWATPIDTEPSYLKAPAVGSNGLVYIQSSRPNGQAGGLVYALDASTSAIHWQSPFGGCYAFGVTIGPDGTLYTAADNGWFYALDGATGAKKWESQTWMRYNVPAVSANGVIYANVYRGLVRAFNASTGQKVWDADIGSGRIADCPVVVGPDNTVYTGTNNFPGTSAGRITAVNGATGAIKWSVTLDGFDVNGMAVAADGTLYATIQNSGKLYALNPADGSVKWQFQSDGVSPTAPSVDADGVVYFRSPSTLYAIK
jgi:outer membrane protein assembly factor BamB